MKKFFEKLSNFTEFVSCNKFNILDDLKNTVLCLLDGENFDSPMKTEHNFFNQHLIVRNFIIT